MKERRRRYESNQYSQKKARVTNQRSYLDWGDNMHVVRKGNGGITMTEGELVRFFGVMWMKLNRRLHTQMPPNLHPEERNAGEEEVLGNGQFRGAQLYPSNKSV